MEECKSPEAEALVAADVRGPNQAPRLLRKSRQRLMLLSLLCKLGSTLAVPKLWLLCKLSPKVLF